MVKKGALRKKNSGNGQRRNAQNEKESVKDGKIEKESDRSQAGESPSKPEKGARKSRRDDQKRRKIKNINSGDWEEVFTR